MLTFSPPDQECLREVVTSIRRSQGMCGERGLLPEALSTPSTAGLDMGWVPQHQALHLQLGSCLVPGPCQQSTTECNVLMFCSLAADHRDLKVSDVWPIRWFGQGDQKGPKGLVTTWKPLLEVCPNH